MYIFCLLLLFLVPCIQGQTTRQFRSTVEISNKPSTNGILTGNFFYDYDNNRYQINYTSGVRELNVYKNDSKQFIRYKICSQCEGQTLSESVPKFFRETSDSSITALTVNGVQCNGFKKSSASGAQVSQVYISAANANIVCRGVLADGTTYTFANVAALGNVDLTVPTICPEPKCSKVMDIVMSLDASLSISAENFEIEKNFSRNFANSFVWGPNNTNMGLIYFNQYGYISSNLTSSRTAWTNSLNAWKTRQCCTCIGCGIRNATALLRKGRPVASRVLVVVTDGKNNVQEDSFQTDINNARNAKITIISVGVDGADNATLYQMATQISGVQTVYYTSDWSGLNAMLNSIIQATCSSVTGNSCGSSCQGYCGCGGACQCPDKCDDGDPCTYDYCSPSLAQCVYVKNVTCDDGNMCTTDTCTTGVGCKYTNVTCNDNQRCTDDTCSTSNGCQYKSKSCSDNNVCTVDRCMNATGVCNNTAVFPCNCGTCTPPNCMDASCNFTSGQCIYTTKSCSDNNVCTNDGCNMTTGECVYTNIDCSDNNACTEDTCDSVSGCNHTAFNVTEVCDDFNTCTIDTCDTTTGCVHTAITCPSDGDMCTSDVCVPNLGCVNQPIDCSATNPNLESCFAMTCDSTQGCIKVAVPDANVDECGVCNGDGSTCITVAEAVGIGAGALAGIIIAAAAVFLILTAIAGKKGYDAYMRHQNDVNGAQNNPMYKDNPNKGTNPFYTS